MLAASKPFSFILFGASGHLAQNKIYPSLYVLALKKRLPSEYAIVGYARSELDDTSFRKLVEESIRADMPEVNEKILSDLLQHVHYQQGQYDDTQDFSALEKKLGTLETGWNENVRLAYLSIPPNVFSSVTTHLTQSGIYDKKIPFRLIVEKPVGGDLASFQKIRKQLVECFAEDEIYLLDHYLGKEAVRNIFYLRFANPILEHLFQNKLIHQVELSAFESAGIEQRAGYFEHTGTFRDMFQSHLLMMMSLLTMHINEEEESFRLSRLDALGMIHLPKVNDMNDVALQGQYSDYHQEEGVDPKSRTNTYAALRLRSKEARWKDVPFYLRSGKRLSKKETRISIVFQEPHPVGQGSTPNRLDIILQGEAGMRLSLQTKLGGTEPQFRPLVMNDPLVCFGDCLPEHSLLFLEAIHGKKQWFLTFEEVEAAWNLVDTVQTHLSKSDTPLYTYEAGSNGPQEADEWIAKEKTTWLYL